MFKTDSIVYAKEIKVLGSIGVLDFINGVVTVVDEKGQLHKDVDFDDLIELEKLGNFEKYEVYQGDVFHLIQDETVLYEIDVAEGTKLKFYKLDENLERVNTDLIAFDVSALDNFVGVLQLVGNIHELREHLDAMVKKLDFNIRIVRHNDEVDGITYFYVGNNIKEETVDLIKVVYMGHQLIEEEEYLRVTLSHEDYLQAVMNGTYKEVSPNELANYVAGLLYGKNAEHSYKTSVPMENHDEDEIEDEDCECTYEDEQCYECGQDYDNCECELWAR